MIFYRANFETFLCFINRISDKHAPIKTVKIRENKVISKKWITRAIKTSAKKTDKLYKQMKKSTTKNKKISKLSSMGHIENTEIK